MCAEQSRRVDAETEIRKLLSRTYAHLFPVDAPVFARLTANEDVLGNSEVGEQVDLLVDRTDALLEGICWGAEGHPCAVEDDRA